MICILLNRKKSVWKGYVSHGFYFIKGKTIQILKISVVTREIGIIKEEDALYYPITVDT